MNEIGRWYPVNELRQRGIEGWALDLDDNLIGCNEVFARQKALFKKACAKIIHTPVDEISETFERANVEAFGSHGVAPERWDAVVETVINKWGHEEEVKAAGTDLKQIYKTVPDWLPGAEKILRLIRLSGLPTAIVTHANIAWTELKIEKLRLADYFDAIVIADERGQKSIQDWRMAADILGIDPRNMIGAGDSVKGDAQAAIAAGYRYFLLTPSPVAHYSEGDCPERTIKINSIEDAWEVVMQLPQIRNHSENRL